MINQDLPEGSRLEILIVDDHEFFLDGTIERLRRQYPDVVLKITSTAGEALSAIKSPYPDLVLLDLSIPETTGGFARTEIGLQFLQKVMQRYPTINLTVLSSNVKALVQLIPEIEGHQGGFTVADKSLSSEVVLARVEWALQGFTHTKDLRSGRAGLEFKPEWYTVLNLAFREGLADKAIAQRMNISERTVRIYFTKIQDVLGVYPEDCRRDGKNIRIQTEIRAREEGLIL